MDNGQERGGSEVGDQLVDYCSERRRWPEQRLWQLDGEKRMDLRYI